jgi:DNA-binding PadR family transcriptional regulator
MLVKGWVTAEWGLSETNRKARYYTLTREGRKQLAREAGDFRKLVDAIELVLQHA